MNPSSVDVLFGVTDASGDITVAADGLDGVTICDVRLNPPVELDWLVAFCENTNLDDTIDGAELELSPVAVAVSDKLAPVAELEEATDNTS